MFCIDESATKDDARLESLAAELTGAVYPIALRHDSRESWADLELTLWRAVIDTIEKWELKCREARKKTRVRQGLSDLREASAHIVRARLQVQ